MAVPQHLPPSILCAKNRLIRTITSPFLLVFLCTSFTFVSCTHTKQTKQKNDLLQVFAKKPKKTVVRVKKTPGEIGRKAKPFLHAVLLNGGDSANSNYYSHVFHLRMMRDLLLKNAIPDKHIEIFSSDGTAPGKDLLVMDRVDPFERMMFHFFRLQFVV